MNVHLVHVHIFLFRLGFYACGCAAQAAEKWVVASFDTNRCETATISFIHFLCVHESQGGIDVTVFRVVD